MKCVALVTAGGSGVRMGRDIAKQYLELDGIPILGRTLLVFQHHELIEEIILTVPAGHEDGCRSSLAARLGIHKLSRIVPGGGTRQESVFSGLEQVTDAEIVAIHDGVRPLVSERTITETIRVARSHGAAVACVPVRDTVKRRNGPHLETIPRAELWLAHTPQTFRTAVIREAHRRARAEGFAGTDDSSLVERMGYPVAIVEDSHENIKITTPEDLVLAQLFLSSSQK